MVAGGHRQAKVSVTYSPALDIISLKMFLSIAISKNYSVSCIDFSSTYLSVENYEQIYLRRADRFTAITREAEGKYLKLRKGL